MPNRHLSTAAVGAIAAGMAFCTLDSPLWGPWASGAYAKSVRRASKPAQIRKVTECELPHVRFEFAGVTAFAFAPLPYTGWPRELRRLQVSGLDERSDDTARTLSIGDGPNIVLNKDVDMTTGKTTSQVAHALVAWLEQISEAERAQWLAAPGISLSVGDLNEARRPAIEIRDSGLTEIEPGTLTVVCR